VVVSTSYSKAVLRAVAGDVERTYPFVDYFPAYEIVTGPQAGAHFLDQDRWGVTDGGIAAVMRVMINHYGGAGRRNPDVAGTRDCLTREATIRWNKSCPTVCTCSPELDEYPANALKNHQTLVMESTSFT